MRSSWKLIPIESSTLRLSFISNLHHKQEIRTWAKGTRVFSDLLEKNLHIYNGVKFVDFITKKEMLGSSLGSFVLTKRITSDIHHKTKKNKKGRLNKHKTK